MPDWSYQPFFRPLLFALPSEASRDVTMGAMGALSRLPLGPSIIEAFGQMAPPEVLRRTVGGLDLLSPVGLDAGLDPNLSGLPALARFGFGYIEIGPVTRDPIVATLPILRDPPRRALWYPDAPVNPGLEYTVRRLRDTLPLPIPVGARLAHRPGADPTEAAAEVCAMIRALRSSVQFITLDTRWGASREQWSDVDWRRHLDAVRATIDDEGAHLPVWVAFPPDLDPQTLLRRLVAAREHGADGFEFGGGIPAGDGYRLYGAPTRDRCLDIVGQVRDKLGDDLLLIISDVVDEPSDAREAIARGANLIQLHSGFVYSGPGLPKRINEALVAHPKATAAPAQVISPTSGWFWMLLLGIGMIVSGVLAWAVAVTVVVLPYDERFLGMPRAVLNLVNPRLLLFMTHDRVTFAGALTSIGIQYALLAYFPLRMGTTWARTALLTSGSLGFASLFLFLGFQYFDPLHVAVTLLLFPLFVMGLRQRVGRPAVTGIPDLHNDVRWMVGLWGQLIFVILGISLTVAGVIISGLGVTQVFVPTDLSYLYTTATTLRAANSHLVPLIAHDRAGLGGALVSDGLVVLLTALWGYRRGARWLWWGWLVAGIAGFATAIGVHFVIGYTDPSHLAPAVAGGALYLVGTVLAYPYLCARVDVSGPEVRSCLLADEA